MKISLFIPLVVLMLGCSQQAHQTTGGQDGGGGHAHVSTSDQVHSAIEAALSLTREPVYQKNIVYNFLGFYRHLLGTSYHGPLVSPIEVAYKVIVGWTSEEWKAEEARQLEENIKKMQAQGVDGSPGDSVTVSGQFERFKYVSDELGQSEIEDNRFTNSVDLEAQHFQKMLNGSPVKILEHDDCGRPIDNHADASVSAFRIGATICFSAQNLRRIAPEDLLREILGLIVHEAAHLSGFAEEDAQTLQFAFTNYYNFRFGAFHERFVRSASKDKFDYMAWTLSEDALNIKSKGSVIFSLQKDRPKDDGPTLAYGLLDLEQTPAWWDPIALQITFQPLRPKAVWAYIYSMVNFITKMHSWLLVHGGLLPQTIDERRKPIKTSPMTWKNLKDVTDDAQKSLNDITDNFQVLTTGVGTLHCEIPSSEALSGYLLYYSEYLKNFETLPDCHEGDSAH